MQNTSLLAMVAFGALLVVVLFCVVVVGIQLYLRRQKAAIAERTRLLFDHEQQLLKARMEEQERVMLQLSRDLHDNLSQQISFLRMNLSGLSDAGAGPHQTAAYLRNCGFIADRLTNELRNISYSLNSDYIKSRGLGEVLATEAGYINSAKGLQCTLEIEGAYQTLPAETELIIYRIAQEGLHNALKHAGASRIRLRLVYGPDTVTLHVTDDGAGFDASDSSLRGLGLHNMQQRAHLLQAELTIASSPGSGCHLRLVAPKVQRKN